MAEPRAQVLVRRRHCRRRRARSATAYFLAKNHGMTNIAVLENGRRRRNTGRNTTIIRSNYLWDESAATLRARPEALGKPARGAEHTTSCSASAASDLAHTLADVRESIRRVEANKLNGVDAEWLTPGKYWKESAPSSTSAKPPLPRDGRHPTSPAPAPPPRPPSPGAMRPHARRAGREPSSRTAKSPASCARTEPRGGRQDQPRHHHTPEVGLLRRRPHLGPGVNGRLPAPLPEPPAPGADVRPSSPSTPAW